QKINLTFAEIEKLEKIFNYYDQQSELFELNKNAARQPIRVSESLFSVVKKTIEFSRLTEGAFDPTVHSPNKQTSYKNIILNGEEKTIFFDRKGLTIDLGGCAKGYIVDQAAKKLKEFGIKSFLINAGGDIIAGGKKWRIGIQHPLIENKILKVLNLKNKAIASSGNYLRLHIINPQDKKAAQRGILSVTVISDSCFKSDILATAFFVLGKDKTLKLIKSLKDDIKGFVVFEQGGKIKIVQLKNGVELIIKQSGRAR
ncbi:MAG: FAD:protein FMN transferase, partial [Candidatus Omnitrophica bacterium]|nr:FAD:protein FMN transferase [Candidatus Omnitrophota bacterium]